MQESTIISRTAHVRGRISGEGDLEIHGRVDGDISIDGDVIVGAEGLIAANIHGRRLTIRGAIRGDITAIESIIIEEGGRVVGDVRSPRIAVAPGGLVRGHVQTGDATGAQPEVARRANADTDVARTETRGGRQPASRAPAAVAARRAAPVSAAARSAVTSLAGAAPGGRVMPTAPVAGSARGASATASTNSSPVKVGPPLPVVPALKKGARGAVKQKKAGT